MTNVLEQNMSVIKSLLDLYRVESQVRGLRGRLDAAERYLNAQERLLNDLQQRHAELETRRRQTQAKIANLESEVKACEERMEKLRGELNAAVNNKQYTAVLNELNGVKKTRSDIEDRVLSEMGSIEACDAELADLKNQIAEREKLRDGAKAELKQRKSDVGDRLAELETQREAAASEVPAKELAIFEELADQYDGEVMADVEEIDRRHREYACSACNMHVPFDHVALLHGAAATLVRCGACGRILYMQEETRGTLASK